MSRGGAPYPSRKFQWENTAGHGGIPANGRLPLRDRMKPIQATGRRYGGIPGGDGGSGQRLGRYGPPAAAPHRRAKTIWMSLACRAKAPPPQAGKSRRSKTAAMEY